MWLRPRWSSVRQANADGQHGVRREQRDRDRADDGLERREHEDRADAGRELDQPAGQRAAGAGAGTVCSETTSSPTVRPKPSTSTASTANGTPHWSAA